MLRAFLCGLLVVLSVALPACAQTQAKTDVPGPDGCGTGWNTWLVPDSIPVFSCQFSAACNIHDGCYGICEGRIKDPKRPECEYLRCRIGGDLEGSPKCRTDLRLVELGADAEARRFKCDAAFHVNLRADNRGKWVCEALAIVYRDAVKKWGKGAFRGIDPTGEILDQPRVEYEQAIRQFFRNGTEDQFKRFVESADRGSPEVRLSKPLGFDPKRGLVNVPER